MVRVCKRECMGRSPGDKPLILTTCHSCGLPKLYEDFEGQKSVLWPSLRLKEHKEEMFCFSSLS